MSTTALEPQLLSVSAAMTVLNLGRTRLYKLINTGRLPAPCMPLSRHRLA